MRCAGAMLALAFAACGSNALKKADASADVAVDVDVAVAVDGAADLRGDDAAADGVDGGPAEALPAGFRAYDVTATLTLAPSSTSNGGDFSAFPTTVPFTFAWNPETGNANVGADGTFDAVHVITADNRTFQSQDWRIGAPFAMACTGAGGLSFSEISFTLEGGTLRGTASGQATYATNAGTFMVAATAALAGGSDATPPTFMSLGTDVDPLAPVLLRASEPLPMITLVSLLSAPNGDTVRLEGTPVVASSTAIAGFTIASRMLRYGETYTLVAGDVADFAGNKPVAPVSFTTRAAPPLVPADGFESVTGSMFAGAGVLQGGPLMPIMGTTSLLLNTGYGGGFGFLPYDLGSSLAVRIAVPAGATTVSFDSQLIAPDPIDTASFVGVIRFASVGGAVSSSQDVTGSGFVKETLPELGDIYVSPVQTITLPLPAGAAGEITFEIVGEIDLCHEPPSPTVLVVDNLRVE